MLCQLRSRFSRRVEIDLRFLSVDLLTRAAVKAGSTSSVRVCSSTSKRERECCILKSKIVERCNRTTDLPCSAINCLAQSKVRPSDTRKEDERMTCTQCHTQNKTGRQYCASCGQRLSHACPQ